MIIKRCTYCSRTIGYRIFDGSTFMDFCETNIRAKNESYMDIVDRYLSPDDEEMIEVGDVLASRDEIDGVIKEAENYTYDDIIKAIDSLRYAKEEDVDKESDNTIHIIAVTMHIDGDRRRVEYGIGMNKASSVAYSDCMKVGKIHMINADKGYVWGISSRDMEDIKYKYNVEMDIEDISVVCNVAIGNISIKEGYIIKGKENYNIKFNIVFDEDGQVKLEYVNKEDSRLLEDEKQKFEREIRRYVGVSQ